MTQTTSFPIFPHRHLLGIKGLTAHDLTTLIDRADANVAISRQLDKKKTSMRGRTQINLFLKIRPGHNPRSNLQEKGSEPM